MSNPPFAQRVPIVGRESGRSFYGDDVQYGYRYIGGAISADPPPSIGLTARTAAIAAWPTDSWGSQRAPGVVVLTFTYGQQPPATYAAKAYALRSAWLESTWPAQRLVGTVFAVPVAQNPPFGLPVVRPAWALDSWDVPRSRYAIQPAPIVQPYSNVKSQASIRGSWVETSYAVVLPANAATLQTLAAPVLFVRAVLPWNGDTWASQSLVQSAWNSPPSPCLPVPQPLYPIRASWGVDMWSAQVAGYVVSGIVPIPPIPPAPMSPVGLYAVDVEFIDSSLRCFRTFQFPDLGPTEERVLTFDFTSDLQLGETLTGIIGVSVECTSGTDPAPLSILNGIASFSSGLTQVQQPVLNGIADNDYYLVVTAPTTNPRKILARYGLLSIRG